VILYILLSGKPPFFGGSDKEILDSVQLGVFSISGNEWSAISAEAKDLVKQMLKYDPNERITAQAALNHEWIKKRVH
jgi:calcium-dependent protein kinase